MKDYEGKCKERKYNDTKLGCTTIFVGGLIIGAIYLLTQIFFELVFVGSIMLGAVWLSFKLGEKLRKDLGVEWPKKNVHLSPDEWIECKAENERKRQHSKDDALIRLKEGWHEFYDGLLKYFGLKGGCEEEAEKEESNNQEEAKDDT